MFTWVSVKKELLTGLNNVTEYRAIAFPPPQWISVNALRRKYDFIRLLEQ
jgi:hypothetical protein